MTIKIKETGWAFGQIRDMEAWYQQLAADPTKLQGKTFSMTGYSLGAHLATAFNILHPGAAQQVVNFNGAGVGEFKTTGNGPKTLNGIIERFALLAKNQDGNAFSFDDSNLATLYARIRAVVNANGTLSNADREMLREIAHPVPDATPPVSLKAQAQAQMIEKSLDRVAIIREEVVRLSGLTSGSSSLGPAHVPEAEIEQAKLDYQMAVLTMAEYTNAASTVGGAVRALTGSVASKQFGNPGNQYDVQADTEPSMVANSQWHIGNQVRVAIEDQPLGRGGYTSALVVPWFDYGNPKLLVSGFTHNDFGDTHSLVLLVDSLSVQNTLLQLVAPAGRDAAQATIKTITAFAVTGDSLDEHLATEFATSKTIYNRKGGQAVAIL